MYICRSLLKHGYSNFSLEILEYCEIKDLLEREDYYFKLWKPEYNILKKAGSSLGFKYSEETKAKMSATALGRNIGSNSWPSPGSGKCEENDKGLRSWFRN